MAEIKSVSVKIGADTKDFIDGLKKADKAIASTAKTAKEIEKGLKLDFNEKNFLQAQKQMQSALEQTRSKAEQIRDRLKELEKSGRVDTEDYRRLELELAKTETSAVKLEKTLKDIQKIKYDSLSQSLEKAGKSMAVVSAAAAGALVGMTKLAKDAVKTGDEIATNATKYNLSAEAIQRWNYIAMQSDVSSEVLYKSMVKTRDALGTKLAGQVNNSTKAIEALGISLESVQTDEQAFNQIIGALSNIKNSTEQAYYANEIFGEKIATELTPLLKQGGEALNEYAKEFESVGYLSNEQVDQLAKFDNAMNKVNAQFQNAKTQLGIALLPVYQTFANLLEKKIVPAIQKVTNWFAQMDDHTKTAITGILTLTAALAPMLLGMSKIVQILPEIQSGLNALFTGNSIVAAITAIVAVLAYLYTTNEKFAKSVNNLLGVLGRALNSVITPIANILSTIIKLVQPLIDLLGNQLAFSLNVVAKILEPIVWLLEKIQSIASAVGNFIGKIFGWQSTPTVSAPQNPSTQPSIPDYSNLDFNIPTGTTNNSANYDYSTQNINVDITMNATGNLDYDKRELANEVIREIVKQKQTIGR